MKELLVFVLVVGVVFGLFLIDLDFEGGWFLFVVDIVKCLFIGYWWLEDFDL